MRLLVLLLAMVFPFAAQALGRSCGAQSGAHTTALVELYTSEGCDSCPPADRWLSSLPGRGYGPQKVVPIALHVDYWDYIGWKDPWAKKAFTLRQRLHASLKHAKLVYTPQVLLQGQDFRAWNRPAFDEEVARINARPAAAKISLALDPKRKDALAVEAVAELAEGVRGEPALYLASYENRLHSEVKAGENRGRRLEHDFVVFEWQGPLDFRGARRLQERRALPLLPQAKPAHSGVAAFVQDRATGEVLQALMLPNCPN